VVYFQIPTPSGLLGEILKTKTESAYLIVSEKFMSTFFMDDFYIERLGGDSFF